MTQRTKSLGVQIGSFVLGGGLLWLALRNVDFAALGEALGSANYWYLVPLIVVTLGSHALRAWRWQMLLEALPGEDGEIRTVRFRPAFFSVMIGYMANYAAPRLGEVVRTANLSSQTRLPFAGVFGTVVVERLLDVLVLAVGVALALFLLADDAAALAPLFEPALALLRDPPVAWWLLIVLGLAVAVGLVLLLRTVLRRIGRRSAERGGAAARLSEAIVGFKDGLASVLRAPRRLGIALTTAAIWVCYLLMTFLPLPMFGIDGFGLGDALVLLVVGSAGMSVPSPGGIGSYHYITIQSLQRLFGVALAPATAYAVFSHAAQLVLYMTVGFACLVAQGSSFGSLRAEAAQREPASKPAPNSAP